MHDGEMSRKNSLAERTYRHWCTPHLDTISTGVAVRGRLELRGALQTTRQPPKTRHVSLARQLSSLGLSFPVYAIVHVPSTLGSPSKKHASFDAAGFLRMVPNPNTATMRRGGESTDQLGLPLSCPWRHP